MYCKKIPSSPVCALRNTLGPTPCPSLQPIDFNSTLPIVEWAGIIKSCKGGSPGITDEWVFGVFMDVLISCSKGSRVDTSRGAIPKISKSLKIIY